ncbi:cysteine--tRNA ligase [Woeseiaceae bacterium]|nr:cysteine--tRNA ligase [Woeseiaceae bacterium]MDB2544128.1 cysteine--tRNA ligase [Woeseiaceae bacterium]
MATKIFLYDTLTGDKLEFKPFKPGKVSMYLCGPTVYNYAHIGNARPAVVFDLLGRLLRQNYDLLFVRNITDVDDKINAAAIESNKSISEITEVYIDAYNSDMAALGVNSPDIEPRATDHINEMIQMIEGLIDTGNAYHADDHVLFSVETYDNYGSLSKRDLSEMLAGARVDVASYKKSAHDFILWKPSTPDLPGWDSPWGRGRPGWHLECSAMIKKHLGKTIDIHAGGQDLVFPHHENEIAQSTCVHQGETFSRYWLHNGFLSIDNTKMSKSLGNVSLVRDLLKDYSGEVIRLALLTAHYRQPLEWSSNTLIAAKKMLDRVYGALRNINVTTQKINNTKVPSLILEALSNDLNTPMAMAEVFSLAKKLNKTLDSNEQENIAAQIYAAGKILGLFEQNANEWFSKITECKYSEDEIQALINEREVARSVKDFNKADRIRDQLLVEGISIEDTSSGVRWLIDK